MNLVFFFVHSVDLSLLVYMKCKRRNEIALQFKSYTIFCFNEPVDYNNFNVKHTYRQKRNLHKASS